MCFDSKWKFFWPRIHDFGLKDVFCHEIIPTKHFQLSATVIILAISNSILCMRVLSKWKGKTAPVHRITLHHCSKSKLFLIFQWLSSPKKDQLHLSKTGLKIASDFSILPSDWNLNMLLKMDFDSIALQPCPLAASWGKYRICVCI